MRKSIFVFLSISVLTILTSACGSANPVISPALISWIDAPLNESTLPLAPYEIVAHGSSSNSVQALEITVNGDILSVVKNPDPAELLFSVRLNWTPLSPGEYRILARSQDTSGQWSTPAEVRVTIVEDFQPPVALDIIPTETPSLVLVNCEPEITATKNTTCRTGPTTYNDLPGIF